jgi:AraC-like DNA-binding protein
MAIPELLEQFGQDPGEILATLNINSTLFDDPDNKIAFDVRSRLFQLCVERTQCLHFGLLLGERAGLSSLGLIGYLAQQSPYVQEALQSIVTFAHLHVLGAVCVLKIEKNSAFFGYSVAFPRLAMREQIEDGAVAIIFNILQKLCGPGWKPTRVEFCHQPPRDTEPFNQFFKCKPQFNGERNGIWFHTDWLQQPLPGADPDLHNFLRKEVDKLVARNSNDFATQVSQVLHYSLLSHHASSDHIAALFGIHSRTLHRRLKACGTSYQELRDAGTYELAQQLLENPALPLGDVAAALGYAETSAFTRAFRRWSGTSPTRWRSAAAHAKP